MSFDPVEYVYQDFMPSEEHGFKESYKHELDTLSRIEFFRIKALRNGQILELRGRACTEEHQTLFQEPMLSKKKNLPRMTMREVINNIAMMKKDEINGSTVQTTPERMG